MTEGHFIIFDKIKERAKRLLYSQSESVDKLLEGFNGTISKARHLTMKLPDT